MADTALVVDKRGLARKLAHKPKVFIIHELLQNAWDEDVTEVHVKAEMLPVPIFSGGIASPSPGEHQVFAADDPTDRTDLGEGAGPESWVPQGMSLAEIEREIIEVAIKRCNSNVSEAAKQLGVSPSTLYRKRAAWEKDQ